MKRNVGRHLTRRIAAVAALALTLVGAAGAQSIPIATAWTITAAGTTDVQVLTARAPTTAQPSRNQRLLCIAATEKAGADATVDFYHGTSSSGTKIMPTLTLNAGESTLKCFPTETGPLVPNGVFAVRGSTNVEIGIYVRRY